MLFGDLQSLWGMRLSTLEIFLIQIVAYSAIWLWDEYVATFVCVVFPCIIGVILLISCIVELIEPSKVPRKYYVIMAVSIAAPLLTGGGFILLYKGNLDWLN